MPKTKGEKLFFSIVMSVVMVYGMELYNLAVQAGGLQNELFGRVFADLPLMCLCSCWRLFKHPGVQFPAVWLQTVALNFPMAFFWQMFFAGPAVRALFRLCFGRKIKG